MRHRVLPSSRLTLGRCDQERDFSVKIQIHTNKTDINSPPDPRHPTAALEKVKQGMALSLTIEGETERQMKAEHINPFIQSVSEVFENMLKCTIEMGIVSIAPIRKGPQDIIGVINLSGSVTGIVALSFPMKTASAVAGKITNTESKTADSSIIDGVGEVITVIAEKARAKLEGHSLSVSLPTIVRGDECRLSNLSGIVWLELPFSSPLGDFTMAVSFKPSPLAHKEAIHEGVVGR